MQGLIIPPKHASITHRGTSSCTQLLANSMNLADLYMQADDLTDTRLLFSSTTIADWIIPAIYMGHIGAVVWLKPPWATQISEGKHNLIVGKDRSSGYIRLGCLTIHHHWSHLLPPPPPPPHTQHTTISYCSNVDIVVMDITARFANIRRL